MNNDAMIWASLDNDLRNVLLERIRRKATATFIAASLPFLFVIGFLPSLFVGGLAAAIHYVVLYRRATRQLTSGSSS